MYSVLSILVLAGLGLIIWAIVDVARRPSLVLSPGAKAGWIIGLVAGTLFFGIVGVITAVVYLVVIRPRLSRFT
ncbi:MAG TPA: hypothetical protein VME20_02375 [Acidimicrobiales bacterium]|nr:hypothetical protein [Acidimicrobiales bacterium]